MVQIRSKARDQKSTRLIHKVFEKKEGVWQPATETLFLDQPLRAILEGDIRFMLEFFIDGQKLFLVTHKEDAQALHRKYPNSPCIHITSLVNFFKKAASDNAMLELMPKIFMFLNIFPEGRVAK